jgi:hypothetical protein
MTDSEKIEKALEIIDRYGAIDGEHHKQWCLDQIARILTGNKYAEWRKEWIDIDEDEECDMWDEGIAP